MANASKTRSGVGAKGKRAGVGAMTDVRKDMIKENMALSNRDKSLHPKERGLDSKEVQNEQLQDHEGNHFDDSEV
jgi:hypothetical protein